MKARPALAVLALLAGATALAALLDRSDTVGGPWSLTSSNGGKLTDRDLRGHPVLLYFGYTSCPDICPATLASVAEALRLLGPRAGSLRPLFVTVDPTRDTPRKLRDYLSAFDPRFVGLTGTPAQIAKVEREWGISVRADGRAIDHTSVLLLVGPSGHLTTPLPPDEPAITLANQLARWL